MGLVNKTITSCSYSHVKFETYLMLNPSYIVFKGENMKMDNVTRVRDNYGWQQIVSLLNMPENSITVMLKKNYEFLINPTFEMNIHWRWNKAFSNLRITVKWISTFLARFQRKNDRRFVSKPAKPETEYFKILSTTAIFMNWNKEYFLCTLEEKTPMDFPF